MKISSCFKYMLLTASVAGISGCGLASIPKGYTPVEKQTLAELDGANYIPRTADERAAVLTQNLFAQAAFWSREFDLNPADLEAAVNLSSTLRRLGNPRQSIEIATQTRALYPRNVDLMTELGASLIADDQPQKALKIIDSALHIRPQTARLWSMKGAALDQMEMFTQARQQYSKALQLSPHDPKIMTNVGLSYALEGDPRTAEVWLRRAANSPSADAKTRQNLALILGLQGKTEEAEKWTRYDGNKSTATSYTANNKPLRGAQNVQPRGPARPLKTSQQRSRQTNTHRQHPSQYRSAPTAQQTSPTTPVRRTLSAYSPQSGGPKTASEAARLAAQQMNNPKAEQISSYERGLPNNVLEKIAQNNRSKREIAAQNNTHNLNIAKQRAENYYARGAQYPGKAPQHLPVQNYPQTNSYGYIPAQSQTDTRPPARTRRR